MRNSTTINSRQCRRTTVKQLLSLLLLYALVLLSLCPLSLTAAAAENQPPEKSTPLQGGVTRYATGAQDQLNTSPTLRPQAPMMDNSTPAPYPLHADKFGGSAVETAPPRFGVGTAMTAPSPAPQFSLRANRYGN